MKPHAGQLHAHNIDHPFFKFLIQEKTNPLKFSLVNLLQSRVLLIGLAKSTCIYYHIILE